MKLRKTSSVFTAIALAFALGACGSSHDSHSPSESPSPSVFVDSKHNQADIAFAQGMIPHHRQALEMNALIKDRTDNQAIIDLGKQIDKAQEPEIVKMTLWLSAWGVPAASGASNQEHGGHGDHGSTNDSSTGGTSTSTADHGMLTAAQMQALRDSSGAKFDQLWLKGMIQHHEGAVQMAKTEIADGENPQAREMAQEIVTSQQKEINQMKKLLQQS